MEYIFIYLLQFFDTIEYIKIVAGVFLSIGGIFYIAGKCQYIADERYYAELKKIYNVVLDKLFYMLLRVLEVIKEVKDEQKQ